MLACSWQSGMATTCRPCCRCPLHPSPHLCPPLPIRDLTHSPSQFARASPSASTPAQDPASSLCKPVVNHSVTIPSHEQALCASSWRGILMADPWRFKPTLPKTPHCSSVHAEPHKLAYFHWLFGLSFGGQANKLETLHFVHCATVWAASWYTPAAHWKLSSHHCFGTLLSLLFCFLWLANGWHELE